MGRNTDNSQTLRVPHGSRPHGHDRHEALCVNDPERGSPPPSSRHHHDRTRTLVSWTPRHIVTPLSCRTPNEISQTTKSSPIKFTREDTSRTPLLVFFPVKPRTHYMVSGRVERGNTRRVGNCGISRPTRICLCGVGVVSVPVKTTSSDLTRVSKNGTSSGEGR